MWYARKQSYRNTNAAQSETIVCGLIPDKAQATGSWSATLCWPETVAFIRQQIVTNPDLILWSQEIIQGQTARVKKKANNFSKVGDGIVSDDA